MSITINTVAQLRSFIRNENITNASADNITAHVGTNWSALQADIFLAADATFDMADGPYGTGTVWDPESCNSDNPGTKTGSMWCANESGGGSALKGAGDGTKGSALWTFDGQNATIKNMKMRAADRGGFFAQTEANVKNLKFEDCYSYGGSSIGIVIGKYDKVGGTAETEKQPVMTNVHCFNCRARGRSAVGGLVGYGFYALYDKCSSNTTKTLPVWNLTTFPASTSSTWQAQYPSGDNAVPWQTVEDPDINDGVERSIEGINAYPSANPQATWSFSAYIGGIVGNSQYNYFTNCSCSVGVSGLNYVGGFCGGHMGIANTSHIEKCSYFGPSLAIGDTTWNTISNGTDWKTLGIFIGLINVHVYAPVKSIAIVGDPSSTPNITRHSTSTGAGVKITIDNQESRMHLWAGGNFVTNYAGASYYLRYSDKIWKWQSYANNPTEETGGVVPDFGVVQIESTLIDPKYHDPTFSTASGYKASNIWSDGTFIAEGTYNGGVEIFNYSDKSSFGTITDSASGFGLGVVLSSNSTHVRVFIADLTNRVRCYISAIGSASFTVEETWTGSSHFGRNMWIWRSTNYEILAIVRRFVDGFVYFKRRELTGSTWTSYGSMHMGKISQFQARSISDTQHILYAGSYQDKKIRIGLATDIDNAGINYYGGTSAWSWSSGYNETSSNYGRYMSVSEDGKICCVMSQNRTYVYKVNDLIDWGGGNGWYWRTKDHQGGGAPLTPQAGAIFEHGGKDVYVFACSVSNDKCKIRVYLEDTLNSSTFYDYEVESIGSRDSWNYGPDAIFVKQNGSEYELTYNMRDHAGAQTKNAWYKHTLTASMLSDWEVLSSYGTYGTPTDVVTSLQVLKENPTVMNFGDTVASGSDSTYSELLGTEQTFDGSASSPITVNSSLVPDLTAPFSVSVWIQGTTTNDVGYIVWRGTDLGTSFETNWGCYVSQNSNLMYSDRGSGTANSQWVSTSNSPINDTGVWHHLVWVWSGDDTLHYSDGVFRGTRDQAAGDPIYDENEITMIGGRGGGAGQAAHFWAGKMKDIRIYTTVLSAENVSDIYTSGNYKIYPGIWIGANHTTDKILYHKYGDYGNSNYNGDPDPPSKLIIKNSSQLRDFLNNAVLTNTSAYKHRILGNSRRFNHVGFGVLRRRTRRRENV